MSNYEGFWSYTHIDDDADQKRISKLAKDVRSEYEMQTGDSIKLFLDKDAIKWGEIWQNKISESLASIAFFIPVLTPRYFMSAKCRRELQFFARKAIKLGIKELVLPLLYLDVPSLNDEKPTDDILAMVSTFQWEDWRDLRFRDVDSEAYRRGVARLAVRLVEANTKANQTDIPASFFKMEASPEEGADNNDETPGHLDLLVAMEEALPLWTKTVESIIKDIELIGNDFINAVADINKADSNGKGFAARLIIARKLSRQLSDPAERIWTASNKFATQLHEVDEGVRIVINQAPMEINQNPESRTLFCEFFQSVHAMSTSAGKGLQSAQEMIDSFSPIETMSRDLRAPLKRLRQGLTTMIESREITDEWVRLIDASEVDCADIPECN